MTVPVAAAENAGEEAGRTVLEVRHVSRTFPKPDGRGTVTVLEDITLTIHDGQVVALLGRSGSGKSTLLRLMAGLLRPTAGEVLHGGELLQGSNPNVAMVFQSFALLPWLTVLQNVELGLQARGVPPLERRERALRAIDLIGLDGFEEAFPKELSGGMRQRVGFARALVVEPDLLLMDEPFSALDVLTGAQLRQRLLELWTSRTIPTRALFIVTHNIEEAVALADRIVVFGSNPGRVRVEVAGLPVAERQRKGSARSDLIDTLYRIMTNPEADAVALLQTGRAASIQRRERYQMLPSVDIDDLTGFVQYLHGIGGRADIRALADDLQMGTDHMLAIVDASDLLGLADLDGRNAVLTETGERFARASLDEGKAILRERGVAQISLLQHIVRALEAAPSHRVSADDVIAELDAVFTPEEAQRQFETAVAWGRYAELFTYHDTTGELRLDEEHRVPLEPSRGRA
jgi:NitT/TauT family transport system ATP-binding protein